MSKEEHKKQGGNAMLRLRGMWENLEMNIGVAAVSVVVVIAFIQVVARYVVGQSLQWAEEICKFGIIWMTFGGAAYAFRMGANIGVSFLVDRLPRKAARVLAVVVQIVLIACFVLLFVVGTERMADQIVKHQVSTAARLPMWIPWLSVPFGSALTVARLVEQLPALLKGPKAKTAECITEERGEESE